MNLRLRKLFTTLLLALISLSLNAQKQITLEDIWTKGTFSQKSLYGVNSMNDGMHFTTLEKTGDVQEINQYQYTTGKKTATLVKGSDLVPTGSTTPIRIDSYSLSPDESKVLISTNTEHIYRHSTRENVYVYDIKTKQLKPLADGDKYQLATFSPDGKKVAYVKDNNLFYSDLGTNAEVRVTGDGKKNEIINGAPDWVYEEEFALVRAFEWSPDSKYIAFLRFDEREVKEYSMAIYDGLYPTEYRFKYPKAGEKNSVVSVHTFDLATKKLTTMNISGVEYIPRIQWTREPGKLAVTTLNRHQNKLEVMKADAATGEAFSIFIEENNTYVEVQDEIHFLKDGNFLWMSERSGFNQLYLIDLNSGDQKRLTEQEQEITSFLGYDEANNKVYYIQVDMVEPLNRSLHSLDLNNFNMVTLTTEDGTHDAKFSKGFKYYLHYYSNANTPLRITVDDPANGKQLRVIQENTDLRNNMKEYGFAETSFFSFKNRNGEDLHGWMIKPVNFDASHRYPVLMYVYGGPGSNTATNTWGGSNAAWYQMLVQKGYIVVSVDNRGTGGRGIKFRTGTYKQLGKQETEDQIDAAKYLGQQSYIDSNRIGIWGWSYGGYMTTLCMTKGAQYFKTGIAVAPVSNWRFYDSIYTERYMQTPQENPNGYDDNSPINHVDKLKGKFLLIHGTADDNVHFQNTTELADALIKAGKPFDMAFYPDKNHSIGGSTTRLHLYNKMTNFILENL